MNLKERGITVGDLLIIVIIILTTTLLIKTFNKDKKTTLYIINQEEIFHKKNLLSKNYLNKLTIWHYSKFFILLKLKDYMWILLKITYTLTLISNIDIGISNI